MLVSLEVLSLRAPPGKETFLNSLTHVHQAAPFDVFCIERQITRQRVGRKVNYHLSLAL